MSNTFLNKLKELNLILLSEYKNAKTKVNIGCKVCGNSWSIIPSNFVSKENGRKCKVCTPLTYYNQKTTEIFKEELSITFPNTTLLSEYYGAKEYVTLGCEKGHTWKALPTNIVSHLSGGACPICFPVNVSEEENDFANFISTIYSGEITRNVRGMLPSNMEIDILLPSISVAFEYNGVYYHNEELRGQKSHKIKYEWLRDTYNIRLIQVWDVEWRDCKEIVKSRIKSILGAGFSLGARHCTVKEIPFPRDFLNSNHIQGAGAPTKYNYGMFLKDELVAVMTFGIPRFSKEADWELVRYCSLLDINIVGGASKLLKHFCREHSGSILSYSDCRWSSGGLYKALGFKYLSTSSPNYKYYKGSICYNRYDCQKHKLKDLFPQHYGDNKTEKEIMREAGFFRTFDAGNDVWIKK